MSIYDSLEFEKAPVITGVFYPLDRKPVMMDSSGVMFMWEDDRDGYTYRMYSEVRLQNGFVVAPKDFRNPPVAYALLSISSDFDLTEKEAF